MRHICYFPDCNYETTIRSKIDYHHVVPREVDKKSKVTIPLCKTHHSLIYVEESKKGQHSIQSNESLIIRGIFKSTQGNSLLYEDSSGKQFYYFPDSKEKWDN